MLQYRVKSDRALVIDGLAVFSKDEERVFSEEEANGFRMQRGVPLNQDNVPEGVEVTIHVVKEA